MPVLDFRGIETCFVCPFDGRTIRSLLACSFLHSACFPDAGLILRQLLILLQYIFNLKFSLACSSFKIIQASVALRSFAAQYIQPWGTRKNKEFQFAKVFHHAIIIMCPQLLSSKTISTLRIRTHELSLLDTTKDSLQFPAWNRHFAWHVHKADLPYIGYEKALNLLGSCILLLPSAASIPVAYWLTILTKENPTLETKHKW